MKRAALLVVVATAGTAHAQRETGWEVRIADSLELVAGTPGSLAVVIAVDRGQTVSKDASVYVDLVPPAGVAIKRRRWLRADAVDPDADEPRFSIPVRADGSRGVIDGSIAVHVRFWVCGSQVCRPVDVRRRVAVTTPRPAPDAGPDPR